MKKIKAFTIAEVLFVMVFIGVVSIISLHTINNRFTDYYTRYYTAYDALSKAAYNTYIDTYCRNKDYGDCKSKKQLEEGRPFPKKPDELRERLKEYLNVTEEFKNTENKNVEVIKNASDKEFNEKSLQLALTNGFRLYFSKEDEITIPHGKYKTNKEINYFIVYVDLNGASKPNRANMHPDFDTSVSSKPNPNTARPDIVPFIVTFKGEVIPVGFPIYDKTYVSARVLDSNGNQTKSYTLNEARSLAFGNDLYYIDMPITLMPLFYKELPNSIKPKNQDKYQFDIGNEGTEDMQCAAGTFNCTVKIDENLGKRF